MVKLELTDEQAEAVLAYLEHEFIVTKGLVDQFYHLLLEALLCGRRSQLVEDIDSFLDEPGNALNGSCDREKLS